MSETLADREARKAALGFPPPGWKHCLNAMDFRGGVFGWTEGGKLWSGIVEDRDYVGMRVKVRDVLPGVIDWTSAARSPLHRDAET